MCLVYPPTGTVQKHGIAVVWCHSRATCWTYFCCNNTHRAARIFPSHQTQVLPLPQTLAAAFIFKSLLYSVDRTVSVMNTKNQRIFYPQCNQPNWRGWSSKRGQPLSARGCKVATRSPSIPSLMVKFEQGLFAMHRHLSCPGNDPQDSN